MTQPKTLQQYAQWVFNWGYEDAMCDCPCVFPHDPDYMAGYRKGQSDRANPQPTTNHEKTDPTQEEKTANRHGF